MARWEWMILLLLFLGLLVVELVRTRRAIRRAGDRSAKPGRAEPPTAE